MNVITANDPWNVLVNPAHTKNRHTFNVKIKTEGDCPNQKDTGRCWIFAGTSVLRIEMMKRFNLKPDFEISQTYLFFYDKFEKANSFLEHMIDLADRDVDDREVQFLLTNPVEDGGTFSMYINVVKKYGLVPKSAYGEVEATCSSHKMNGLITARLREFALQIRNALAQGVPVNEVRLVKRDMLQEIYRILVIFLSEPPKTFDWELYDKDGVFISYPDLTPQKFRDDVVEAKVEDNISLLNDTRHEYNKVYTVNRLRNVVGGIPVLYVNIDVEHMKQLVIKVLKSDRGVWFGVDGGQFLNRKYGIHDTRLTDYRLAFDVEFNTTKSDRVRYKGSLMTHAMVLTGVHLDEHGKPVRWRVQNSYAKSCGDEGFLSMSDEFFTEYVFQVVLEKKDVPDEYVNLLETETPVVLNAWDPMGSLA
ncbi:peptidase C1B, bleomycin hydrolase [Hesseltinella vesiculosa]|uniref:Cysteine proteinase 1, mitochondrial n=1 Tax=Hesseltinella vesiculosa TaxID=101127 RepID=A0A1X2GJ93_9FUNG|nr:peptidase C1B, bleomycin hydrolase [Hesseltinella vesiculosa]